MRQLRTHAAVPHSFLSWSVAACDSSSFHPLSDVPEWVDCRRCMYLIGWYVPLTKLREHQLDQRLSARIRARRAQNFNASGNPEFSNP